MKRKRVFTVGGTVQAGSGAYLARAVDEELLDLCQTGSYAYVLTARQMGKSSLMVRTAERLQEEGAATVIIDLSQIGANVAAESWYVGLLTMIESRLALETDAYDWWVEHENIGPTQRLVQFFQEVVLHEHSERVVVFIDEIDTTLSLDFTDDFFAALRAMHNARSVSPEFERLSFVLIGVAMPGDLISDPKRTPFNIGHGVDVGYFTADEAAPLLAGFDLSPDNARDTLKWVLDWTGGHPFLTQRLCSVVSEGASDRVTKQEVDRAVRQTFFGDQSEKDANLRFVQDMLTRRAPDPEAVLITYGSIIKGQTVVDDRQSLAISHLKLSGVVRRSGKQLHISNPIYAHVFDRVWLGEHLPRHWIRSVPPAVLGLVAASFIAIIALGALFFARSEANQAQREQALLQETNVDLAAQRDSTSGLNRLLLEADAERTRLLGDVQQANTGLQVAVDDARRSEGRAQQANSDLQVQIAEAERLRGEAESARDASDRANLTSDSLRVLAETARDAATEARRETLVLALSTASQRLARSGDAELAALLARRAYSYSESGAFDDAVLEAMMASLNALEPDLGTNAGGPVVLNVPAGAPNAVQLSPDGQTVIAGTEDGMVRRWQSMDDTFAETHAFQAHDGGVRSMITGVEGFDLVTAGEDGRVLAWTLTDDGDADPTELGQIDDGAWILAAEPGGSRVAAAGADDVVLFFDLQNASATPHQTLPSGARIRALAFDRAGDQFAWGGTDGAVYVWTMDRPLGEEAWFNAGAGAVSALVFDPSGNQLSVAGAQKTISVYARDAASGSWSQASLLEGHEARVYSLAYDEGGDRLFSGSADRTVHVWHMDGPERQPMVLGSHTGWVTALSVSRDGNTLVSGSSDRSVRVWSLDMDALASKICDRVGRAELTEEEWQRYVGSDFPYGDGESTCPANLMDVATGTEDLP